MDKAKIYIMRNFPFLRKILREARDFKYRIQSPQRIFSQIYINNDWGDKESYSGPGSNLEQTREIRLLLPAIIREFKVNSLLDVPCGDYFWMNKVALNVEYIGGDIVPELIVNNQRRYGNSQHKFINMNLLQDALPKTDLILCRDCFVHFSFFHIFESLKNIKASQASYLLTTTFINRERNEDIPTGKWRSINLQKPPFNFPSPIKLVDEKCPVKGFEDKNLGLWQIKDLPIT
jgi:hypothetical protein